VNQQDEGSFSDDKFNNSAFVPGAGGGTFNNSFTGLPGGFQASSDPHGFILQFTAGRRNSRKAEVVNQFANVTNLTLSETTVTGRCAAGFRPREGVVCSDDMEVGVTTTAVDPENDVLTYNYTVSGGRIVGQGANVSWDLTGAQPGTYTITAGVDDGCGVCGTTQTRTITVAECDCVQVCECPTFDVTGPAGVVNAGETLTFTANVSGGTATTVTYNWTVTSGTITEGQGTPVIRVATTGDQAGSALTASVEIGGVCDQCERTKSVTVQFPVALAPRQVDEFGALSNDDVKARVQNFFVELNNDPSATGYIINYGTAREIARREKQINDAIRFLRLDASRITQVRGGETGGEVRTVFFVVPAGVTPPAPQ
jgi:hypothetical protein